MISPEIIRRYSFSAGLSHDQILVLAQAAEELSVDTGHTFFHEGDEYCCIHLILEGAVAILMEVPASSAANDIAGQLTGELASKDIVLSTLGAGDVFSWSALAPPYTATAGAKATVPSRIIAFDAKKLLKAFEADYQFGYKMLQQVAQVSRDRLRDARIESLSTLTAAS